MITILNYAAMLATIAFGLIAWIKPRYAMKKLDLKTDGSTLGLSEIRAANGALFVGIAVAALLINAPLGFAMVGFAYAGAAVGRGTSIILDGSGQTTSYAFIAVEIALAAYLILAHLL
ncbi:MAG: DUF4345 family protein [Pseudomonadota bacterium]